MTERLRHIKKREDDKLLYEYVYADITVYGNRTVMFVDDIRHINKLKKKGIINEH